MDGSTRTAVHKMRSMRFASSKDARSLRIEMHNDNRRMARQAKSNAHRGLSEININTFPRELDESVAIPAAEPTHEQKLQDRLNKLKLWREQKAAVQQKEKARKKAPFVVPCHPTNPKSEKSGKEAGTASTKASERTTRSQAVKETPAALTKPVERVTRSQAKKNGNDIKKTPAPVKASNRAKKIVASQKWEVQSFAPTNFIFTAPQEITKKGMDLMNPIASETLPTPSPSSKTPQKAKTSETPDEEIKVSPLLANNPWITMTRGSSSKKSSGRKSMDPASASVADVQASPALKRRSKKPEPMEADEPKDPRDAAYFRALVSLEESRLTALCDMWEEFLAADVPEEETGSVRTVIGQAQLLQRERFVQFGGLIDQFENKTGEKEITPTDLEGFWEMIYLQVTDVDRKFGELSQLRDNGWVRSEKSTEKKERPKRKAKEVAAAAVARPPRAVRSNLRAHIAAARKNQMMAKSPKSPSVNRRRSSLLCSPHRTPGKRQSLRRSALILSAKKQMFIVTDMTNPEDEPRISQYVPAEEREEKASTVERLSVPEESVGVKCPTPRRRSSKKSLKADLSAADASPTCQNIEETREPMDCDDALPDGAASTTPLVQRTYGKSPRSAPNNKSPEERLSEAFDALKAEESDKATPLKVFRTPKVGRKYQRKSIQFTESETKEKEKCDSPMTSEESGHCRRSSRLRTKEDKGGRPSLLPTVAVSPAEPKDDLMSFD